jgi:hypothetical protein
MKIKKANEYECVKTVVMDDGDVEYVKGRVYLSELEHCLTDESGIISHFVSLDSSVWAEEHFKKVTSKKSLEKRVDALEKMQRNVDLLKWGTDNTYPTAAKFKALAEHANAINDIIKNKTMKQELKEKIDRASSLKELHKVWELIKTAKLSEDKFLMAWYDFKYNIMGAI